MFLQDHLLEELLEAGLEQDVTSSLLKSQVSIIGQYKDGKKKQEKVDQSAEGCLGLWGITDTQYSP